MPSVLPAPEIRVFAGAAAMLQFLLVRLMERRLVRPIAKAARETILIDSA